MYNWLNKNTTDWISNTTDWESHIYNWSKNIQLIEYQTRLWLKYRQLIEKGTLLQLIKKTDNWLHIKHNWSKKAHVQLIEQNTQLIEVTLTTDWTTDNWLKKGTITTD